MREITFTQICHLKDCIIQLEQDDQKEFKLEMSPLSDIIDVFEKAGYKSNEDYETNGWQADFWQSFTKGTVVISLSGSLYYGGFVISIKKP